MRAWALGQVVRSCTRSSPPVFAQSLVPWIKVHALVDACGGRVPDFEKLAFVFGVLFPTTVALSQSNAWPVETVQGEKRILILFSDGAFVFLHTRAELPTGLAHVGAGTFRARYLVYHVPLLLRWESVLYTYQRAPK